MSTNRCLRGFFGAVSALQALLVFAWAASAQVTINEFMALNGGAVTNVLGESSDWIELRNAGADAVELTGWHLTDNAADLDKWTFPSCSLAAGGYLLVWADGSAVPVVSNELHASFKLDGDGEYLALVGPDGVSVVHDYAPEYPPQATDISYGIDPRFGQLRYFATPTPGAANTDVFDGFVADTKFSHDRGFYSNAFDVAITCATPDVVIRYTTDGSTPCETNGAVYAGPVHIGGTTLLRAIATKSGYQSSDVDTQTYLFLDDILKQDGSGLPPYAYWGHDGPDWGVDPSMTNSVLTDSEGRTFTLRDALVSLPTVSLVTDWAYWWSGDDGPPMADGTVPWLGIYADKEGESNVKRPVSMEFFTSDGEDEFAANGIVNVVGGGIGGTSADRWKTDKLSLRVSFSEETGPAKLKYPVFGSDATDTFDSLILDAHLAWMWTHAGSYPQRQAVKIVSDAYGSDLQNAMSGNGGAPHSRFVHLYLNGLYWGLYDMHERPDEHFAAAYLGGDNDDYDSIKHLPNDTSSADSDHDGDPYNDNISKGDDADLLDLLALSRAGMSALAGYEALAAKLDIDHFIDYMLENFYVGNNDWAHKNWYASHNHLDPAGRWRYHSWDVEHVLEAGFTDPSIAGALNCNVTTKNDSGGPTEIHRDLEVNAEYRLRFADHVHRHCFNGGVLSPATATAMFRARVEEVERGVLGEAARWADNSEPHSYSEWYTHMQDLLRDYFPFRTSYLLAQLTARGLYPSVAAPELMVDGARQHGGLFADGAELTFDTTNAVYYTLDGTDPREYGTGAAIGTACAGPITLSRAVHVKARVLSGGVWSALTDAVFTPEEAPALRVTEVMYHPRPADGGATNDTSDYEFVELYNADDHAIGLAGVHFADGLQFDFTAGSVDVLEPGAYAVVVADATAFAQRYAARGSMAVAGEYQRTYQLPRKTLSNGGERIRIKDGAGRTLVDFTYGDGRGWPVAADGAGHSLVPLAPDEQEQADGALDYGGNWRASAYIDGSPGSADPLPVRDVCLNEFMAHTDYSAGAPWQDSDDWIELYNTTAAPVSLGDWYLSDDPADLRKWPIPVDRTIPALAWRVFEEVADFHPSPTNGFGLDKSGECVLLSYLPGDGSDRVADAVAFKGQENGYSLGRYPDGAPDWLALAPTPGGANAPPADHVVISEIMYHPEAPDGESGEDEDLEFVELTNPTAEPVALFNETGTWRLGGIGYSFPTGTVIAAGARLVVVGFDPVARPDKRAAFLAAYAVGESEIALLGPFNGELSNGGQRIALERPEAPDAVGLPVVWVIVDEVIYLDEAPWPSEADGGGRSLRRRELSGTPAVTNWVAAAAATPGLPPVAVSILSPANGAVLVASTSVTLRVAVDAEMLTAPCAHTDVRVNGLPTARLSAGETSVSLTGIREEGCYTLDVTVVDQLGNSYTGRTHSINVWGVPVAGGAYRLPIAFGGYDGSGALTGFPVLVRLGPGIAGFDYGQFASPGGDDLRFTDAAGTRALSYEIEEWNPAGESAVWVRVPELTATTTIWASWGDAGMTGSPPYATDGSVWSQGYEAVWHLNAPHADATGRGHALTAEGTSDSAGVAGRAREFSGSSETPEFLTPDVAAAWYAAHDHALTVTAWARPDTLPAYTSGTVFGADTPGGTLVVEARNMRFGNWGFSVGATLEAGATFVVGQWQYLALVLNAGAASRVVNGGAPVTVLGGTAAFAPTDTPLIGARGGGGERAPFNGCIDEVRLSSVARGADWLRAEYRVVADNAAFVQYGAITTRDSDDDHDGMSDRWEIDTFGATNAPHGAADADADGDGMRNDAEFIAGTDATNPASFFVLHAHASNAMLMIDVPTVSAANLGSAWTRFYSLEHAASPAGSAWFGIDGATNVTGTGGLWRNVTDMRMAPPGRIRGRVWLERQ